MGELLTEHIRKEDEILYPWMEQQLSDGQIGRLATATFTIPDTLDLLTPILTIVPLQLFSYYVAVRRGCNGQNGQFS